MGPIDPHDAVPIRVLKTLLRLNIPSLRPRVQEAIDQAFETCMQDGKLASDGDYATDVFGAWLTVARVETNQHLPFFRGD